MINLDDNDNGRVINSSVGDIIVVKLGWKPSSGYFWQDNETSAGDLIEIKHEGDDMTPGATVYVIFKFKIRKTGVIQLSYSRPWSETQPPVKWFAVNVTV